MKRIILMLLVAVMGCGAQAQICDDGFSVVAGGFRSINNENKAWEARLGADYTFHITKRFYVQPDASVYFKKYHYADKAAGGLALGGVAGLTVARFQCERSIDIFTGPKLNCEFIRAKELEPWLVANPFSTSLVKLSPSYETISHMFQLYWRAGIAFNIERIRLSGAVSMPLTYYYDGNRMWGIDFAVAYKLPL